MRQRTSSGVPRTRPRTAVRLSAFRRHGQRCVRLVSATCTKLRVPACRGFPTDSPDADVRGGSEEISFHDVISASVGPGDREIPGVESPGVFAPEIPERLPHLWHPCRLPAGPPRVASWAGRAGVDLPRTGSDSDLVKEPSRSRSGVPSVTGHLRAALARVPGGVFRYPSLAARIRKSTPCRVREVAPATPRRFTTAAACGPGRGTLVRVRTGPVVYQASPDDFCN